MQDTLEDWQLALLVEARRYDDPVIVEANEAAELQDAQDLLEQADGVMNPVVVEHSEYQQFEEAEALLEAAEGVDEWELVDSDTRAEEQEALEAVEELLSDALKQQNNLRDSVVETMHAPAMVSQFRDEDEGDIELESLAQIPETGGASEEEVDDADVDDGGDDAADPLEDLSASERSEVSDKLDTAAMMADRTPDYAESLRSEAAAIVGVEDADEIDTEAL